MNTDYISFIGVHEVHLQAYLVTSPSVTTVNSVVLPINFLRCEVEADPWVISDVVVPAALSVSHIELKPTFSFPVL